MADEPLTRGAISPRGRLKSDPRIELILGALLDMAGQKFNSRLTISDQRDEIDAIMLSINMLSEELNSHEEELRKSREQLVQSAKLASLGEMASGLSHELNNPLFIVMGYLEVLEGVLASQYPEAQRAVKKHIGEVHSAANRIKKIIEHMRDFSRLSKNEIVTTDINTIVQDSFTLLNKQLELSQISVRLSLHESPLWVGVDKIKMEQVFVNLITNARDAILEKAAADGGEIAVATHREGDAVVARVSDTGIGMTEAVKSRIFDAFFTTKEVGKGTGLGLSVSFGILQSFGATIDCQSTPGQGTEFTIRIPMAPPPDI